MDFMALTPELMITGLSSCINLSKPKNDWGEIESVQIERIVQSLASSVMSLRKKVHVRYLARSEPSFRVADGVNVLI